MGKTSVVDIHKVKGKRPAYDLCIGRAVQYTEFTEDSKYCNPFSIFRWGTRALPMFECYIRQLLLMPPNSALSCTPGETAAINQAVKNAIRRWGAGAWHLEDLVGKRLGCWCVTTAEITPAKCHGQIYMKFIRERGLE